MQGLDQSGHEQSVSRSSLPVWEHGQAYGPEGVLDVVRHPARQQAGGDDGLFRHGRLDRRSQSGGLMVRTPMLTSVGTLAGALHLGCDPAGPDVDGYDLSPAGVGAAPVETAPDLEFLKGLEPPLGPPVGAEGAAFGPGPDAASDLYWLGVQVVVVAHRRSCFGE